jgi:small conductance mechanosensitive channel
MDTSLQSLDQVRASALDMAVRFGPKLFVALIIIAAGYMVGRWVGRFLDSLLLRLNLEAPVRSLLVRATRVLVVGMFVIMAMQGILGNVAAGLTIIFTRPFHVGDYISIANEEGEILDISLFSTTLGHTDHSMVVIPNRKIVGEILHNCGRTRQLNLAVDMAYGTDVALALGVVDEILRANPRVLQDPAPVVGIARLADSGVTLRVSPWVKVPDYVDATGELNRAILDTFRARGIAIPFPQREIRMLGGDA